MPSLKAPIPSLISVCLYNAWKKSVESFFSFPFKRALFIDQGPVQITSKEFENGCFSLKTNQMFSFHITPEKLENATITGHFGFVFAKKLGQGRHRFQKAPLSKCCPST